jgi:hypothetical protein
VKSSGINSVKLIGGAPQPPAKMGAKAKTKAKGKAKVRGKAKAVHEVNYKCRKNRDTLYLTYYLTPEERREVIKTISDSACLLLEYYLKRAGASRTRLMEGQITDAQAAEYFGWTASKAGRIRRDLERHGWFSSLPFQSPKGRKSIHYYIGKEAVLQSQRQP